MVSSQSAVKGLAKENFPAFRKQKAFADTISKWTGGRQATIPRGPDSPVDRYIRRDGSSPGFPLDGQPYMPREFTDEYQDLATRAPDPWARLVVVSLAQTASITGVRRKDSSDNMKVWYEGWQRNGWDAKQISLNHATIGTGIAYGISTKGNLRGGSLEPAVKREAVSCREFAGFYNEPSDEWAAFGIRAIPQPSTPNEVKRWAVRVYDDTAIHYLSCKNDGHDITDWTYIDHITHPMKVPPFVRYCNSYDLDGYPMGEIEPILPLLRRLDQDTFDRLIVQRFGAWKVRYIAGMAKPGNLTDAHAEKLRMRLEDILIAEDHETRFGTLEATDGNPYIAFKDADLRCLSAVTQIPPHHLLGLSSNLQAEALAAAEASLMRKSGDYRMFTGEAHEQHFRLDATILGLREEANAFDMQVRWKDVESRSFVQLANALGLVADKLKVPTEMLWEKLPEWTDQDTERAKALLQSGELERLLAAIDTSLAGAAGPKSTGGGDNLPVNG